MASLRLDPGQPNPFNPRTTFSYSLPDAGRVRLAVSGLRATKVTLAR